MTRQILHASYNITILEVHPRIDYSHIFLTKPFRLYSAGTNPPCTAVLDTRVNLLRSSVLADSTKKTYSSYLQPYLHFCNSKGIPLVPITPVNLARFIALLSYKLSFNSIRNYLSVVRLLHLEAGFANPLDSYYISSLLKGTKRVLGAQTVRKLPITPNILYRIFNILNFSNPKHLCFWAACLVGFFSFFRKSNLLAPSWEQFDPSKHMSRNNVRFSKTGAVIVVTWSKTIQYMQRSLLVPLPHIPKSPFCPSCILRLVFMLNPTNLPSCPAFMYILDSKNHILSYATFLQMLKSCLSQIGLDPSKYSGHSFRRGGASFALQCGLPPDLIKSQGDWKSDAYQSYLDPSLSFRVQVAERLGSEMLRRFPTPT